jgi:hypothetical protein
MPTHSMICAHPCPPMPTRAIQIVPMCITRLHQVLVGSDNKRSFIVIGFSLERFLVSVFPTSKKFDPDLELDAGMHKTGAHPCPPMNNNIAPMPTQNPWAWVGMGMGMGTQCRVSVSTHVNCTWKLHLALIKV